MDSLIGIDLGSRTIKIVEVLPHKDGPQLLAAGEVATPPKALLSSLPADHEAIAIALKELIKEAGVKSKNAVIALPESQVFTRVIEVPQLSERELISAIKWEAEQYIPLPLDQVNLDFAVLRDSHETGRNVMEVLLVAAPKILTEKYVSIMERADINPLAAETEIIAATRVAVRTTPQVRTVMLASMGAQTTDLAITKGGILAFTRSISAGGEALTRAISQGVDIDLNQSEEFKRTYGLESDKLEGKLVNAVKPILDTIISEMKRAIVYFEEKYKDERVDTLLLTGGTAKTPGLVPYFTQVLGVETQLANPWLAVKKDARFNILDPEAPMFTIAVGLTLRD